MVVWEGLGWCGWDWGDICGGEVVWVGLGWFGFGFGLGLKIKLGV